MYWPRAVFEACAWGIGFFMLKQLSVFSKPLENQKSWQNRVGNRMAEELWGEIKEWGLGGQFDVHISPNRIPFQISVVMFDPLTPVVWGLEHKHGSEVFRVEVQYPNLLAMTIFDGDKEATKRSCYHTTEEQMLVDAKEILFYVVSKFTVERVTG